jgi:hypothetical protein
VISTRTNTALLNYRSQGKGGMKPPSICRQMQCALLKLVCKVENPLPHAFHYENAERMLLATFVSCLAGEPCRQVRYANPPTMEKALQIALSVEQAERQEKLNKTFNLQSRSPTCTRNGKHKPRRSADARREVSHTPAQRHKAPPSQDKLPRALTETAVRCYGCEGKGNFARECPTRLKREVNSTTSPGRRNPSERSRRSGYPANGLLTQCKKGKKATKNQGN